MSIVMASNSTLKKFEMATDKPMKIALITGGYSGEAEVSYKSARSVLNHLDKSRWEAHWLDICPDGWFYVDEVGQRRPINKDDFSVRTENETIQFEAALIMLHGTPGEDGKLQGYLDCIGMPYTSCNAATSALTFNKRYTVAVAAFGGISVARSLHLFREQPYDLASILNQLKLPVFVKPNNGGSSLGMSKVNEPDHLDEAIRKAFGEDQQVLIEECIAGREFTIGVLSFNQEIITLPITEIITQNEFFDYEAKYKGASQEITPAQLDESMAARIRETAVSIYRIFNCSGVVRIDFIYNEKDQQPYMLEINTVPGQSEASIIPQQVRAKGWTLTAFYSTLLDECLAKKNRKFA
ncbi:MAG: D-alanine--D-alanine ligase [Ferruginibacter sp.]